MNNHILLFEKWSEQNIDIESGIRVLRSRVTGGAKSARIRDIILHYFTNVEWFINGVENKLRILINSNQLDGLYDEEAGKLLNIFNSDLDIYKIESLLKNYFTDYTTGETGSIQVYVDYKDKNDNFSPARKFFTADNVDDAMSMAYQWIQKNLDYFKPDMIKIKK